MARVRSLLRRAASNQDGKNKNILSFADLKLNLISREVWRGDRLIDLTAKEFNILHYFTLNAQQVLSRQQIFDRVWNDDMFVEKRVIEVHIRHLRQKLEAKQEKRLIQTVRGIGYVLRKNSGN